MHMKWPDGQPYYSLNQYYRECFGDKTYKLALDMGTTCPNRDGTLSHRGCIYCSGKGSGDFAQKVNANDVENQITDAIKAIENKYKGEHFIAYLQSYTNTYGDSGWLKNIYETILQDERIVGLSIGTRPDCLSEEIIDILKVLNQQKPIWIELGLQTIHENSARFINRCYPLKTFDQAVNRLHEAGIPTVVHLIAGLPGETMDEFLESVEYIASLPIQGVKFHSLHVLQDTQLGAMYEKAPFSLPSLEAYCNTITEAIALLPTAMVVHRLTGDAPRQLHLAPTWSLDKRKVLNTIHKTFKERQLWQSKHYSKKEPDWIQYKINTSEANNDRQ